MILHDLDLALSLGDYFIHLLDGKIEFCGLNSEYKNFLRSKLMI